MVLKIGFRIVCLLLLLAACGGDRSLPSAATPDAVGLDATPAVTQSAAQQPDASPPPKITTPPDQESYELVVFYSPL
jgi:hypothetical protein